MFVLTILGTVFGYIKSFFVKHWKLVVILIAAVLLFLAHQHYVHEYGEAQFKKGVDTTLSKVKTEVTNRNTLNRAIENKADIGIKTFADTRKKQDDERHSLEQKSQDRIKTSIDSVAMWKSQECSITPQIMAERNAIRALGPQQGVK